MGEVKILQFEVRKKELSGKERIYFQTSDPEYVPDKHQLESMARAGYSAYMNGKPYRTAKRPGK